MTLDKIINEIVEDLDSDKKEKWPGQSNGLPEPDTDEWKNLHEEAWKTTRPKVSDISDPAPLTGEGLED